MTAEPWDSRSIRVQYHEPDVVEMGIQDFTGYGTVDEFLDTVDWIQNALPSHAYYSDRHAGFIVTIDDLQAVIDHPPSDQKHMYILEETLQAVKLSNPKFVQINIGMED
jgi:hypothetical protein